MLYPLARSCADLGAEVELISGPVGLSIEHPLIHRTNVTTAAEMYDAATTLFPGQDAAILCAAVADFTPAHTAPQKIKREGAGALHLELVPTKDIAAALGKMKTSHQRLIGFALETHNEEAHALDKMQRKNLDFIVMNSLQDKGAGFGVDTNKITIFHRDGTSALYALKSKDEVADDIVACLQHIL